MGSARSNQAQEFMLKDLKFHEKILEITGNEYLELALRRLVLPPFGILGYSDTYPSFRWFVARVQDRSSGCCLPAPDRGHPQLCFFGILRQRLCALARTFDGALQSGERPRACPRRTRIGD